MMAVAIAPYNYCTTYIKDPRICYLSLARNFGHQIAVTAGLNFVGVKLLSSLTPTYKTTRTHPRHD